MNCREFKSNHVGFVDDILSASDMAEMRRHLQGCAKCATLDTRIRRSLLVVRNLPQIQPSADFYERLSEALRTPEPTPARRPVAAAAAVATVTAALAAAVYFAMAIIPAGEPSAALATPQVAAVAPAAPLPMNEVSIAAAVPAGVPVWPAMFMVGEIPTHLASAEMLESTLGR